MLKWCFIIILVQASQFSLVKSCPRCQAAAASVYNPEPQYIPGVSVWDAIPKPPCAPPLQIYQPPPPLPKYKILPSGPCRCSQRVTKLPACTACRAERKALIQEKFEQLKSKLCSELSSIFCREDCIHSRPKPPPCSCRKNPCGCY